VVALATVIDSSKEKKIMRNYSSPEVVEVGSASELVRGLKPSVNPDNDGSSEMHLPLITVVDVD